MTTESIHEAVRDGVARGVAVVALSGGVLIGQAGVLAAQPA
jgi:hypothetical protein